MTDPAPTPPSGTPHPIVGTIEQAIAALITVKERVLENGLVDIDVTEDLHVIAANLVATPISSQSFSEATTAITSMESALTSWRTNYLVVGKDADEAWRQLKGFVIAAHGIEAALAHKTGAYINPNP
jgi:hypothetical protein